MKISAEFLPGAHNTDVEQAATAARITINLGEVNVTEFQGDQQSGQSIVMPASVLAEGLIERWWRLRGGRGRKVHMREFRQGFATPDIVFTADSEVIIIECKHYSYGNPSITFTKSAQEECQADAVLSDVRQFCSLVANKLVDDGINSSLISSYLERTKESENDPMEREFCLAAGALGLDPYTVDDAEAALIERAATAFGGESLLEFLSAMVPSQTQQAVDWIQREEERLGGRIQLQDLNALGADIRAKLPGKPLNASELGYKAAKMTRISLGRSEIDHFTSVPHLAKSLGSPGFKLSNKAIPGLRAVVDRDGPHSKILVGMGHVPSSRLFAFSRAIGDSIIYADVGRSPITDTDGYRQAAGRAFAAELLAPAELIAQLKRESWEDSEIAQKCHVSEWVIQHQMENLTTRQADAA